MSTGVQIGYVPPTPRTPLAVPLRYVHNFCTDVFQAEYIKWCSLQIGIFIHI